MPQPRVLNKLTLIQNQNCAQTMKAYLPSTHTTKKETPPKICGDLPATFPVKTPLTPIVLKHDSSSESASLQKQKGSMEHLCLLFLERIAPKNHGNFEAKELLDDSGIKKRRIYDLMNILEGCGFVQRISKGTYDWRGFDPAEAVAFSQKKRKDSSSLSCLAARIKRTLLQSPDLIDFKNIVKLVVEQSQDTNLNPDSVKRRIYECCKVLKVLGLIEKKSHSFRWITSHPLPSSAKPIRSMPTTKSRRRTEHTQRTEPCEQMRELTSSVVDKLHTEQDLNAFVLQLRGAFQRKLEQHAGVERQLKYE